MQNNRTQVKFTSTLLAVYSVRRVRGTIEIVTGYENFKGIISQIKTLQCLKDPCEGN
jgi:hypothetical protein